MFQGSVRIPSPGYFVYRILRAKPIRMANIKAGSFSIDYVSEKLADEIIINFINPDLDWQLDTVRALSPGTTIPENSVTLDIAGMRSHLLRATQS